jgi:hypothetical protein
MADAIRITPEETYQKLRAGKALLVCAYDNEERFRNLQLEGAISFSELRAKLPALSKDQEIVLYCA